MRTDDTEGWSVAFLVLPGVDSEMGIGNLDAARIESLLEPSEKGAAHIPLFQRDGLEAAAQDHRRIRPVLHPRDLDVFQYLLPQSFIGTHIPANFTHDFAGLVDVFAVGNAHVNDSIGITARFV